MHYCRLVPFALLLLSLTTIATPSLSNAVYPEYGSFLTTAIQQREQKVYDELDRDLVRYHVSTEEMADGKSMQDLADQGGRKGSPAYDDTFKPPADGNIAQQIAKFSSFAQKLQGFNPTSFLGFADDKGATRTCSVSAPRAKSSDGRLLASPIVGARLIGAGAANSEQKTPRKPEHYQYGRSLTEPKADDPFPQPNFNAPQCGTYNKAGC